MRMDLVHGVRHLLLHTSTNHKRFVLFAMLVGAVLRIIRLDGPITYEEALTYSNYASRPFGFLFADYTVTSNHILYSALSRISILLFGVHPWSLRLPALVAGLLAMPLGYVFVRNVFNRHIAVIFVGLLAVSGPLVEYSAMARGYSLVWLFSLGALLAARHYVKTENLASGVVMALCTALGLWAAPGMIYPAIMIYLWTIFMVLATYESTVRRRVTKVLVSAALAAVLAIVCYMPVIMTHGVDHLLHHPTLVENTWNRFMSTHQDQTFELWAYFSGSTSTALAFIGMVAVMYAAYISRKYRLLLIALVLGSLPVILLQHVVAPPAVWTFSLLVFHMGGAVSIFYLLKVIRDKLAPGFNKPQRSMVAGLLVMLVLGWTGLRGGGDTVERFPDALKAAEWLAANARPADRLCVQSPWDAPMAFYLASSKSALAIERGNQPVEGRVLVLVAPAFGQTPEQVLMDAGLRAEGAEEFAELKSWGRLELYVLQ